MKFPSLQSCAIAVIGLGYVGLPLAVEFARTNKCIRTGKVLDRRIIGFDIDEQRLSELRTGYDRTNEIKDLDLSKIDQLEFTSDQKKLLEADVFIVTVPTPIDSANKPDLTPLQKASKSIGEILALRKNSEESKPLVIYESTVYPGVTEEICVPIIENESGIKLNEGFSCGYSPERINPGDKNNRLTNIIKITSGSDGNSSAWIDNLYGSIIKAGTHLAPSIKVAEAAKIIENTQRDLNIAFVNELAILFKRMGIDTLDVIEAAGTKWNFLKFKPGIVGGHCIGVDPYYLSYKSEQLNYHPQVFTAGRRINDTWSSWVVEQLVFEMARRANIISGSRVLICGFTFKENCPDIRNTRVIDLVRSLESFGMKVDVIDPYADPNEAYQEYKIKLSSKRIMERKYEVVISAVAHDKFKSLSNQDWKDFLNHNGILYDIKGIIPRELNPIRI